MYQTDKSGLDTSPLFREQFVGLGPYRLTEWVQGSHIEATRFDDYHHGSPAPRQGGGALHPGPERARRQRHGGRHRHGGAEVGRNRRGPPATPPVGGDREQRADRGAATHHLPGDDAAARICAPLNGLPNVTVRQALSHAIDRQGIADAATGGLGLPADSWYDPKDPLRRDMESYIAKYPYDPARAQQLLTQAGWTRGADGVVANGGERFQSEVWVNPQASGPAGAVVADNWKAVGLDTSLHIVPLARAQDRGYISQRPGALATDLGTTGIAPTDRYDSREFATAANNWSGRNRAGYVNPRADELYDALNMTVDANRRLPLLQEQVRLFTSDVAYMPLYWMIANTISTRAVKADIHPNAPAFRVYLWDRE